DLILNHMRPGDVHTHVFAQQFPIVQPSGGLYDHLWQARERGVLFDLGHGAGSFWFRNAVPALSAGFPPDSISTDLHLSSLNGAALDTLHTVSKCMAMGMPLGGSLPHNGDPGQGHSTARARHAVAGRRSGHRCPALGGSVARVCGLRSWASRGPRRARMRSDTAGRSGRVGPRWTEHAQVARGAAGVLAD